MDCACLVHKICGCYNKGVYVQLIRSTTRRYFQGRQHGIGTVAKKFSIGGLYVCSGGLEILKFDKNSTDL